MTITGASEIIPGQFRDKGGAVLNVMHPDYGAAGNGSTDDTAAIQAALTAIPTRGGVVVIPPGVYKVTAPLTFPARNTFHDNARVALIGRGAVLMSYDATAGRAVLDLDSLVGQEGETLIEGLILDGGNASSTGIGINVKSDNVTVRDVSVRLFAGKGIKFTNSLSVPPIRCLLDNVRVLACGVGVDANGSSCAGLQMSHCSIEASNGVGVDLTDASQVTMIECVVENSGIVTTTAQNLLVMGSTDLTAIGCYFEDNASQVHDSIFIDATANVMPGARFYGGRLVGYQVATSRGFNVGSSGGAVRGVVISGMYFFGHKVGIQLGAGVAGYVIDGNNWSDTFNPSGGTATRIVNNSTARGVVNNLDRFAATADSYEIRGPILGTSTGAINDALTVGLGTGADKASGAGNFYDVLVAQGKVTAGAAVRASVYCSSANSAYINVMSGATTGMGAFLKSRGTSGSAELGVTQNVNLDMSLNGTTQATLDTSGIFNARLGFKVAGTQVVGPRDTGFTAMTGTPDEGTAYATSTITLAQLAGRVMALQTALTTHGLIGT